MIDNEVALRKQIDALQCEWDLSKDREKRTFDTMTLMAANKQRLENSFNSLKKKAKALKTAAENMDCSCTVRQRDSGHLVDCWMPKVREALADLKKL